MINLLDWLHTNCYFTLLHNQHNDNDVKQKSKQTIKRNHSSYL